MDKGYADTVRLLLTVAPEVFANDIFAMKGGTAINLFVQDMPRLSVDIDVVFQPRQMPRDEAVAAIDAELAAIGQRVASLGLRARRLRGADAIDTKLIVEFDAPILARDELYAGKLVAALDRQHPRDLFDVWQLYESGGLTDAMVECFVVYLAGHNRPLHEVLFGNDKDIAAEYERAFAGMTEVPCTLDTLRAARARLRLELPHPLTAMHRQFLSGLMRAEPDWSLMQYPHAAELPALRWKLANLETFRKRRPADFQAQAEALDAGLNRVGALR